MLALIGGTRSGGLLGVWKHGLPGPRVKGVRLLLRCLKILSANSWALELIHLSEPSQKKLAQTMTFLYLPEHSLYGCYSETVFFALIEFRDKAYNLEELKVPSTTTRPG